MLAVRCGRARALLRAGVGGRLERQKKRWGERGGFFFHSSLIFHSFSLLISPLHHGRRPAPAQERADRAGPHGLGFRAPCAVVVRARPPHPFFFIFFLLVRARVHRVNASHVLHGGGDGCLPPATSPPAVARRVGCLMEHPAEGERGGALAGRYHKTRAHAQRSRCACSPLACARTQGCADGFAHKTAGPLRALCFFF